MSRIVRVVTAGAFSLSLFLVPSASGASAQEMEHGRTRPTVQAPASNKTITRDLVIQGVVNNVRG